MFVAIVHAPGRRDPENQKLDEILSMHEAAISGENELNFNMRTLDKYLACWSPFSPVHETGHIGGLDRRRQLLLDILDECDDVCLSNLNCRSS